ncbi:DUF4159 domain-containing protein [Aestuariibius sp. 2305UL40-4]|uniref:DUF4159 domain-containing protein n=1 Tax=Aestuariibius violaceus TaxID=3234132 RepID=UPI00345E95AA
MWVIGPLGFTAPWLLLGLIALPILWILLRAVPPAPIRRRFPGVALLLGLQDDETQSDRTPWWLLLLRMIAVAAIILGFAGPVLNPQEERTGSGPLLVLIDGTWADAPDWPRRMERLSSLLDDAARRARPVAVALTTDPPEQIAFQAAEAWEPRLAALDPAPYPPAPDEIVAWADAIEGPFETFWMSDGLDRPEREPLLAALEENGNVTVYQTGRPILGLGPATFEEGQIALTAIRSSGGLPQDISLLAHGLDPAGVERVLARADATFAPQATEVEIALALPPELRNRISRFEIEGVRSAGAVTLTDDALKRREVALIAGQEAREQAELLSPLHYLEQALIPSADLLDGALQDILPANPDVIVLADVARLSEGERDSVSDWVENGGMLLRFAGPRLAASDVSRNVEDPLMPVRLRAGGRTVGGAMSWGEPKALAPFDEDSPFYGLPVPDDVAVSAQVVAEPGPDLGERVIAELSDGTPLVTRKPMGEGQIVLFHVTANAEWSTLPLSGLFVSMLERLAVSTRPSTPDAEDLAGTVWAPEEVLDAFGRLAEADRLGGVPGEQLAEGILSQQMPPGLYAGEDRRIAVNVIGAETELSPVMWPARIPVEAPREGREFPLKGILIALAMVLLAADIIASLAVSGRLSGPRGGVTAAILAALVFAAPADAQDTTANDAETQLALTATSEVVLAHVLTGDPQVDDVAAAGLRGLSQTLFRRTSIEPAAPVAVDLERDELAFFPFLYWPITANQQVPSQAAYTKLNRYLRNGGMILFDTRDADTAGFGSGSPEGRRLQAIARPLDIPPLEPVPDDHVLTRTFYLIQAFPGRYSSRDVWVEAAPPDAERAPGMPFRNLNDGVTPVVIGGNDWASAWAIDQRGGVMLPVGRGAAGERQREFAYRFGVNLIMHVLTGNYKSDQVHVPDLLDRLGQ